MVGFIRKKLELKIILTVTMVIAFMIGSFAYIDIRDMRQDTIRTSERTLGAFAAAIKASVVGSMKKGHHGDVRQVLEEVNAPYFINRIMIYDSAGRPLQHVEKFHVQGGLGPGLPPGIADSVVNGDISRVTERDDAHFISYYAPIQNRQECFRCHDAQAKLNGILRVDFSLRDLDDLVRSRRNRVLIWSLQLIVLLTVVLVALLRTLVYRPVRELRDAISNVPDGLVPLALSTRGRDELADLKRSFVSMINRISALHQTNLDKEKELVHNEENMRFRKELQTMFDAMPDAVLLIDRSMKIIQSNPRVYALLPQVAPAGGHIQPDCTSKDCCPFQAISEVLKQGKMISSQCSITLPDKEARHLHSICAPIVEGGRVEYVVQVIRDMTDRVKTERELEERTAELLAANRLLSRIAITDSLTRVYNRRYLDEFLYKEVKRFNRRKYSHLSLMMIDIDRFKDLNDRYGHIAGDTVLREIATTLRENVRETDTVARYGGEEFVIVMPDTHLDGAEYRAEILRKKVESRQFPAGVRTTISIGVARYLSGPPHELVKAADQALYEAKKCGRNRVVVNRVDAAAEEE